MRTEIAHAERCPAGRTDQSPIESVCFIRRSGDYSPQGTRAVEVQTQFPSFVSSPDTGQGHRSNRTGGRAPRGGEATGVRGQSPVGLD
jgi:hypothetical protein